MKNIIVNFELNKGKYDQFHHSFFFFNIIQRILSQIFYLVNNFMSNQNKFKKKNLKLLFKNIQKSKLVFQELRQIKCFIQLSIFL